MTAPAHDNESGPSAAPRGWRLAVLAASWPIAAGAAVGLGQAGSLTIASTVMLGILLLAAILWVSEAIGAMATSLLVIALCVALLGVPATLGAPWVLAHSRITGWEQFIAPAGSGVMLLLLGSMALGVAVHRTGLDHHVGERVLRPFMGSARSLAFGLMLASAFMSLWMSNTATAAIMLALARGLAPRFEPAPTLGDATHPASASRVRAGLALAVALGANVGGIGSPVGTPPGAIIFTRLEKMNEPVTFLGWMAIGVPIAIVVLAAGWFALTRGLGLPPATPPLPSSPAEHARPAPDARARRRAARERRVVALVFLITVGLWLTGGLTGIPVEAAALVPLAVLPAAGILRPRDMGQIDWDVLLLILGGLVLGTGMELSGLAEQVVAAAPLAGVSGVTLVAIAAVTALVLSAFMSNTATANLLAPIGLGLAASISVDTHGLDLPTAVGFAIALGAGASMPLAVATPANAMAARDGVRARDFLVVGLAVGLAVVLATVALAAILL